MAYAALHLVYLLGRFAYGVSRAAYFVCRLAYVVRRSVYFFIQAVYGLNWSQFAGTRQIFQHIRAIRACEDHPSLKYRRGCEKISRRWCPRVPARRLGWGGWVGVPRPTICAVYLRVRVRCFSLAIITAALCRDCVLSNLSSRLRHASRVSCPRAWVWGIVCNARGCWRRAACLSSREARRIFSCSLDRVRLGAAVASGAPSPRYSPYN